MAGLLNFANLEDDDPRLAASLAALGAPNAADSGADAAATAPQAANEDDEDEEDAAQAAKMAQEEDAAQAAKMAQEEPAAAPDQGSDQAVRPEDLKGFLNAQQQPEPKRGLLSRIFGTDDQGISFRDKVLASSMGLGGNAAGGGQYLQGVRQQAYTQRVQQAALQRQIAGQQLISRAAGGSFDMDTNGQPKVNPGKFWTGLFALSKKTGLPIDPEASKKALADLQGAGQWKFETAKDGTVTATNLNDASLSYVVHGPTAATVIPRYGILDRPNVRAGPASGLPAAASAVGPAAAVPPPPPPPQAAPGAGGGPGGASDQAPVLGSPVAKDGARPPTTATADEAYKLASMIESEAGAEPLVGKVAAGSVALNRMAGGYGGAKTLSDVLSPSEFMGLKTGKKPSAVSLAVAHDLIAGRYADPTKGADHYLNPELTKQMTGGKVPQWAANWESQGQRIGRHVFLGGGAAQGGAPEAGGVAQPAAAATAPVQVQSPADVAKLAPGTTFRTPDGRIKMVPPAAQAAAGPTQGGATTAPNGDTLISGWQPPHPPGTPGTPAENVAAGYLKEAPTQWDQNGMLKIMGGTGYNQATAYKQTAMAATQAAQNQQFIGNIDEALKSLIGNQVKVGPLSFNTAGGMSQILRDVPQTASLDFGDKINGLKASLSKDTLEQMRNMSPRGGAFGNTSTREFTAISNIVQNLDARKDPQQTAKDLLSLRQHYVAWQKNIKAALAAGVTAWGNPYSGVMGNDDAGAGGGDTDASPDQ